MSIKIKTNDGWKEVSNSIVDSYSKTESDNKYVVKGTKTITFTPSTGFVIHTAEGVGASWIGGNKYYFSMCLKNNTGGAIGGVNYLMGTFSGGTCTGAALATCCYETVAAGVYLQAVVGGGGSNVLYLRCANNAVPANSYIWFTGVIEIN